MGEADDRDWIAEWAAALLEGGCAAPTQRRYLSAARVFSAWFEQQNHEPLTPQRLTPIDLAGNVQ